MADDTLREELFLLLGYLLTSAYGLFEEPQGYGPFRLLSAASRLLAIQEAHGLSDPYLQDLRQKLDAEQISNSTDEQLKDFLDQMCQQYTRELKTRSVKPDR